MRVGLFLAVALLIACGAIAVVAAGLELRTRASSPEEVVRAYFAALEAGDLDAALRAIEPSGRPSASGFVANLLGNEFRIEGIAVRQPSLLDQLSGQPPGPTDVTVFLAITETSNGSRWEAAPRVSLVQEEGRWYLGRPPLAD